MIKPANIIKLLLVEDSLEDAERLTSVLRNAGITVRAAQARNAAEFETQLQTQTPDLILIGVANASPTLGAAVNTAKRGGKDISVIALLDALTEDDVSSAL